MHKHPPRKQLTLNSWPSSFKAFFLCRIFYWGPKGNFRWYIPPPRLPLSPTPHLSRKWHEPAENRAESSLSVSSKTGRIKEKKKNNFLLSVRQRKRKKKKCLSGSVCLFCLNCLFTEYTVRALSYFLRLSPSGASDSLTQQMHRVDWRFHGRKKKNSKQSDLYSFLTKGDLFQNFCSWNPTKGFVGQGKSRISDEVLHPGNRGFSYLLSFYDLINMAISNPSRNLWLIWS